MKYLTILWYVIKNRKQLKKIYDESTDIYTVGKATLEDGKVSKEELSQLLDEVLEMLNAVKKLLGGK